MTRERAGDRSDDRRERDEAAPLSGDVGSAFEDARSRPGDVPSVEGAQAGFAERDVGEIIALATRLQMEARSGAASPARSATSEAQIREIAQGLGIAPEFLERAMQTVRNDHGNVVLHGSLSRVRQQLIEHFAGATWSPGGAHLPATVPRIALRGDRELQIDWGGAVLHLALQPHEGDTVSLTWETSPWPSRYGGLWANAVFSLLAFGPAVPIWLGSGWVPAALWAIFVGGSMLGGQLLQRHAFALAERRFQGFCRRHVENLQLMSRARSDGPA